ncbi:hypothetical protein Sgleb_59380 [Streptomyces glebosus]|uniref:Uncharacterized protein n=1 Tax=Streptomyces glebosus TaxID=249580 RepID=A0A640T5V1_9ACTN|nr:hypothetical protein Sgleb_59380 [Streptomyces glebosus]
MFGEECVDDPCDLSDRSEVIDRRLGIPDLWPLAPESWDEDTFYGLIEVFHDLRARPVTAEELEDSAGLPAQGRRRSPGHARHRPAP